MAIYYTLRIQIYPKKGIDYLQFYDLGYGDVSTINPTRNREGSGFLGL